MSKELETEKKQKTLYNKQYRETHREELIQKDKAWRQANPDVWKASKKLYRETHKDEIKEYEKERSNKRLQQKIVCDCGVECSNTHLSRHRKSKFHMDWVSSR